MGLLSRLRRAVVHRPGTVWEGPAAYCADHGEVPWPGFYALNPDGKGFLQPLVRLVAVDDAPGDPRDGAWHLEVAGPNDPPTRQGRPVHFEAHATGSTEVGL